MFSELDKRITTICDDFDWSEILSTLHFLKSNEENNLNEKYLRSQIKNLILEALLQMVKYGHDYYFITTNHIKVEIQSHTNWFKRKILLERPLEEMAITVSFIFAESYEEFF